MDDPLEYLLKSKPNYETSLIEKTLILTEKIRELQKTIHKLKYGKSPSTNKGQITKTLSTRLLRPLSLRDLKSLTKADLIEVLLTREKTIYNKIDEWNTNNKIESIEIFKILQQENKQLHKQIKENTKGNKNG